MIEVRPLHEIFGAEVSGIDLSERITESEFEQLQDLFYQYSLLVFRNQALSPAGQAALCRRFGKPKIETRKQYNFQEHPEVSTIGNITAPDGKPLSFFSHGRLGWHTDGTAACHVNAATFLYAVEVPDDGGDTLFCSAAYAYEHAPGKLIQMLQPVSFLASFHAHNDPLYEKDPESFIALTRQERDAIPPVWHRIVQTHPVTGRKLFYLNLDPLEFDGIDDVEGRACLQQVLKLATRSEQVYRHRWSPGELVIWDNHAMLHSDTPVVDPADRRLMHRSFVYTLPTERPLPNYTEVSQIFAPTTESIRLSDFN